MPDHLTELYDLAIRETYNEAGKLLKVSFRFMPKHPTWKVAMYREGAVEYRTILFFGLNTPVEPSAAGDVSWGDCAAIDPSSGRFFHLGSMNVYFNEAAFVDGMREWKRESEYREREYERLRKEDPDGFPF